MYFKKIFISFSNFRILITETFCDLEFFIFGEVRWILGKLFRRILNLYDDWMIGIYHVNLIWNLIFKIKLNKILNLIYFDNIY